jgi:hypothetical protein
VYVSSKVDIFRISSDDQWVIYETAISDIYNVPIKGGAPTGLFTYDGDRTWRISPDSSQVVWQDEDTLPNWVELYSIPIAGGPQTRINGPMPPLLGNVHDFTCLRDGSGVVYRADQDFDTVNELYASLFVPGADLHIRKVITPADAVAASGAITITDVVSPALSSGTIISNTATIASDVTDDAYEDNESTAAIAVADRYGVYMPVVLNNR